MGVRVDNVFSAAAGVIETITENKVQKTQKAFASFLDSAVKGKTSSSDDVGKYLSSNTESDKKCVNDKIAAGNEAGEPKQTAAKTERKDKNVDSANKADKSNDNVTDDDVKLVENVEEAIKSVIAQQLGITIEELEQTLNTMGISALDLLDNMTLLDFTMQINGIDDVSVILTDENLMAQYTNLTDEISFAVENILDENNISVEELTNIVENVKSKEANAATDLNYAEVQVNTAAQASAAKVDSTADKTNLIEYEVNETDETEADNIKSVEASNQKDDGQSGEKSASDSGRQDNGNLFAQHNKTDINNGIPVGMSQQNQTVNTIVDNISSAQMSYTTVEMEDIVNQIVERIKVEVNSQTTSMEMQLNPESYGKLQLHVAVKEGMVTAQMTVESEAARRAVETQIVQLRENMNNQGLKVEAIEVTVASHEFDRNLQQESNANQQAFEEEQQKAASKRMNLNLTMEDWDEDGFEELSDAEVLERKIMLESGNRMSIQA